MTDTFSFFNIDPKTGQTYSAPQIPPSGQTATGQSFLGADGFLSKAAETATDLFGLYGQYDLQKTQIETAGADRSNPDLVESQYRAGFFPQVIQDYSVPIYIVGGIAAVGILAAITIAATKN